MTIDDARENFMSDVYNTLDFLPTNNEANRIIDSFDRVTSGLNQQPCDDNWRFYYNHGYTQAKRDLSCEDCVSRKAAIDIIESWLSCDDYNEAERHIMRAMQSVLYDLPPVTPKEKTGKWIDDEFGSKCSYCGGYTHLDKFDRPMKLMYCSKCGAKMVGVREK